MKLSFLRISLVMFLVFGGCAASVPDTHYYTFQSTVSLDVKTEKAKYPYVLGVETYNADVPYQQDKIVFRNSVYEVNFYEYHRWLRPPTELVTDQVLKHLRASGLFPSVYGEDVGSPVNYVLQGRILMFDQWYNDQNTTTTQVGIHYQLLDLEQEHMVLWAETIETSATTPNREILETIKAFEAALHTNILQAISAIDRVLAQDS